MELLSIIYISLIIFCCLVLIVIIFSFSAYKVRTKGKEKDYNALIESEKKKTKKTATKAKNPVKTRAAIKKEHISAPINPQRDNIHKKQFATTDQRGRIKRIRMDSNKRISILNKGILPDNNESQDAIRERNTQNENFSNQYKQDEENIFFKVKVQKKEK